MFDFHSAPENRELMTFETETGHRANRIWQLPQSYEDLKTRRAGLEAWTELHAGFLGRHPTMWPPAFPACIWGWSCSRPMIRPARRRSRTINRYARDNDLYLTYVIINPQADRSRSAAEQQTPSSPPGSWIRTPRA